MPAQTTILAGCLVVGSLLLIVISWFLFQLNSKISHLLAATAEWRNSLTKVVVTQPIVVVRQAARQSRGLVNKGVLEGDSARGDSQGATTAAKSECVTDAGGGAAPGAPFSADVPKEPENTPPPPLKAEDVIVQAYNAGGAKLTQLALSFGVLNARDTFTDRTVAPRFGLLSNGNYWLLKDEGGVGFVVPKLGIVFQSSHHDTEAMGTVFKCEGYQPGYIYRRITLRKPARFANQGDLWELQDPGAIELGQPERARS